MNKGFGLQQFMELNPNIFFEVHEGKIVVNPLPKKDPLLKIHQPANTKEKGSLGFIFKGMKEGEKKQKEGKIFVEAKPVRK